MVPDEPVACDPANPACPAGFECVRGRCAKPLDASATEGFQYLRCSSGVPKNAVRTNGSTVPEPLETIEICYQVDVGADLSQCQ